MMSRLQPVSKKPFKPALLLAAVALLAVLVAPAGKTGQVDAAAAALEKGPFTVGEKLSYRIYYKAGFITMTGGSAFIKVMSQKTSKTKDSYYIYIWARSNGIVDAFFEVRDAISCEYDWKRQVPLWGVKNLREGDYKRIYRTWFNNSKKFVTFSQEEYKGNTNERGKKNEDAEWEKKKKTVTGLKPNTQNVCSSIFYMRQIGGDSTVGSATVIPLFDDGQLTNLKMTVKGKEKIEVDAGTFNAFIVEPKFSTTGIFTQKAKDVRVYVSDDENRYILKVKAEVPVIGQIIVELVKIDKGG